MRYGFIGLGNLGGHLAASLLKAGFEVTVNDLDPSFGKRHVDMGGAWAATPSGPGARLRRHRDLPAVAARFRRRFSGRC